MKKFEAVSGDQSLFDLLKSSDDDLYVVRNVGLSSAQCAIYPCEVQPFEDYTHLEVIAERKPIEKYVPKVGDLFHEVGSASVFLCINVKDSLEVIGLATGFHMLMEKDGSYLRAGIMDNFNVTFLRHGTVSIFGNDYIS